MGPGTGRGLGYCIGHSIPGCTKGGGLGLARGGGGEVGRGLARGFRGGKGPALRCSPMRRLIPFTRVPERRETAAPYSGEYTEEDEIEDLKAYAENLQMELEAVQERLDELSD